MPLLFRRNDKGRRMALSFGRRRWACSNVCRLLRKDVFFSRRTTNRIKNHENIRDIPSSHFLVLLHNCSLDKKSVHVRFNNIGCHIISRNGFNIWPMKIILGIIAIIVEIYLSFFLFAVVLVPLAVNSWFWLATYIIAGFISFGVIMATAVFTLDSWNTSSA